MSLHLGGVGGTGADALDINVSDSVVVTTPNGTFVITSTGFGGGLAVYRLHPNGQLVVQDTQLFPGSVQDDVSAQIAVTVIDGEQVIIFGGDDEDALGYTLHPDGQIGALRRIDWADIEAAAAEDTFGAFDALSMYNGAADMLATTQLTPDTLVSMQNVSVVTQRYVLSLGGESGQVFSHVVNANGSLSPVASLGALDGLALASPTAMEVANFDDCSYAVVASGAGSSLSVIEIAPDGSLTPVQQLIDTASTRFANVQDLALVQEGDHVFVMAVGSDHGVTVFRLLPDGHLVFVEAFSDDRGGLLNRPSSITAQMVDDTLHVFVGTQNTAQMVHLDSDQSNLGRVATSSTRNADELSGGGRDDVLIAGSDRDTLSGGGGDDILSSGQGRSTLTGGNGADIFVVRSESTIVTITDFQVGSDRLDLSDLPMLRNLDQLEITSTATGAIIRFRDYEIVVTAQDGAPLNRSDLFPDGLVGPDSVFIVIGEPDPVPPPADPDDGVQLIGTNSSDTLFGGIGPDTIHGERGNDWLYGVGGNDTIDGGMGHDKIWGGAGRDHLIGGDGNDRIRGGTGHDLIQGAAGNDTIHGEQGRDTIHGGTGDDMIYGNGGNDRLFGGQGRDLLKGGNGNDSIWGGGGNDSLHGDRGDDIIHAGGGKDQVRGGGGDDTIHGNGGNDRLFGGKGRDIVEGGKGNDRIWGGGGNDSLYGNHGNDLIRAGGGKDRVRGGSGDDTIQGNGGNDRLFGDQGRDLIEGGNGNDSIWGGGGNDSLYGNRGNDLIRGGGGDDRVWGGSGNDMLFGNGGKDTLRGGRGNDTLRGGNGDDRLLGGSGDDRLIAGRGDDTVFGGRGADTFVFGDGDDTLTIRNFRFSQNDRLELDADLWGGGMDVAQVLDIYGRVSGGDIVLDFGNGDIVTIANMTNINRLEDYVTIV